MKSEKKSFLVAFSTILVLMIFTYVLTLTLDCKGISLIKFVLSPILTLGASGGITIISICIFLLIIGGVSYNLNECGFMKYMLDKIVHKYGTQRYKLLWIIPLFFMCLGSLIGSFEEVVPITPIVVSLIVGLGFDVYTGLAISLLATGFGFAAGVFNPFNIGVAQSLVNIPMFSGVSLRLLTFVLIYLSLELLVITHARKIARDIDSEVNKDFEVDINKQKAFKAFVIILSIGLVLVLSSSFITVLRDYTIIIIGLFFLIAGVTSTILSKTSAKKFFSNFLKGALDIAPSIILILMASSIKYIMEESGVINTVVDILINLTSSMSKVSLILFIYLICLILEVFIPSGSAKAFLLIPLVAPVALKYGISLQLVVLAYAFGDGFSNVYYPTNPALIICLGLVKLDYKDWFKHSIKYQLTNLIITCGILLLGLAINY